MGVCTNIASGQDPATECAGATNCNGNGACALFSNGTACTLAAECTSGNCIDGVCCNAVCGGACKACNLAAAVGTCTNIPNLQDPANECTGAQVCNGNAACVGGPTGAACAANSECASMQCIDGVCCNTACGALCQACNVAGNIGTCTSIPNGADPANECPGSTNCNGAAACALLANGAVCAANAECTSGNCIDGVCCNTACGALCQACNVAGSVGTCSNIVAGNDPANECANGACSAGACKLDNGQGCAAGSACLSNQCIDGFCCNTACSGTCLACNVAGLAGTCSNVPNATDPANECAGVTNCNGAGACGLLSNGTVCAVGGECSSGNCIDGVCCNTACGALCQACNVAGSVGTCSNIVAGNDPANECANGACSAGACKLDNGQGCAAGSACLSNQCIDGFCCNTACSGTCQACSNALTGSPNGTCDNVNAGLETANECTGTTTCNGTGACGLFAVGQACAINGECANGQCVDGMCCGTNACSPCQTCNGGTPGTCTNIPIDVVDNNPVGLCTGTSSCDGAGICRKNDGQTCPGGNGDCVHGHCVDGFCCNTACSGTCQACSAVLTGGTNGTCSDLLPDTDPIDECIGAKVCGMMGTCVLGAAGATCPVNGADANCSSNNCVDGVCCLSATCSGTCKSCDQALTVAGAAGTCDFIKVNTDPDTECPGAQNCDGGGMCTP